MSPFYFFSYVISKVEIWKANPRKKDELWLFPGVHEYPFTYALPIDLPESMDESGYASINYTIKVCYVNKKKSFNHFLKYIIYTLMSYMFIL